MKARLSLISPLLLLIVAMALPASAAEQWVNNATIYAVYGNGTPSSSGSSNTMSCIQITDVTLPNCPSGYAAIPSNSLLATALTAKAMGTTQNVSIYYTDSNTPQLACQGYTYTPCQILTIVVK